jgi:hypothetical protein
MLESKNEKIIRLLNETNLSHREIAKILKCSPATISRVRQKFSCKRDNESEQQQSTTKPSKVVVSVIKPTKETVKTSSSKEYDDVQYNWVLTSTNATIVGSDASQYLADRTHPQFDRISKFIIAGMIHEAIEIIDIKPQIFRWSNDRIKIEGNVLLLDGRELHGKLTQRIIDSTQNNESFQKYVNFLQKLDENPDANIFNDLFDFVEHANIEIAEDGDIIAWKRVRENHKDFYSNTFLHTIGQTVKMKRRDCDANRNHTCSTGLHVCAKEYLKHYQCGQGVIAKIKLNPKDVVAIPTDYNFTKMRVCEYVPLAFPDLAI